MRFVPASLLALVRLSLLAPQRRDVSPRRPLWHVVLQPNDRCFNGTCLGCSRDRGVTLRNFLRATAQVCLVRYGASDGCRQTRCTRGITTEFTMLS